MPAHKTNHKRSARTGKPRSTQARAANSKVAFLPINVKTESAQPGATAAAEIPVAVKTSGDRPVVRTAEIPVRLSTDRKSGAPLALHQGGGTRKVTALPLALGNRRATPKRKARRKPAAAAPVPSEEPRRDPATVWNKAVEAITEAEMYAVDLVFDLIRTFVWVIAGKSAEAPTARARARVVAIDTLRTVEDAALAA